MHNPRLVLRACQMHFHGNSVEDIAKKLDISSQTIYKLRRTALWKEFQEELIAAEKKVLMQQSSNRAELQATAQG